jgi:hypothetical protein
MTFYATAAAAIAAFLAVKAADRQERATFTSALYGKQVEVLANIDSKLDRLGELVGKNVREGLEGTPRPDAYTDEITVAATSLREAIYSAEVVYPKEAMLVLDEAAASVQGVVGFEINRTWGRIDAGPLGGVVKPLVRDPKGNDPLAIVVNNISQLRECSKLQLRDGQNIDGPKINKLCAIRQIY